MAVQPKLAHVVLQTGRLAEMREWYCALLDAHVVVEGDGFVFLTYDEEHHRIALVQPPFPVEPKSPLAAGMQHMAFTFACLDDLLARYAELAGRGVQPKVPVQHGVTTSLYYRDPDGNFVELQSDNFPTPEQATEYMLGEEYARDPLGPLFDPQAMRAARADGATVGQLTSRSWALATQEQAADPASVWA
jgi:catechol-2,3-dioxygenase